MKNRGFIRTPLLIGIIIFLVVVVGIGCRIFKNHIATTSRDTAFSTAAVEEFMKARIEKNYEKSLSFLTDNAKEQYSQPGLSLIGTSNPHFSDFEILERQKLSDGKFEFKVRIYEGYADKDRVGYFDETLTVIKRERNKYLIDSAERGEYTNL